MDEKVNTDESTKIVRESLVTIVKQKGRSALNIPVNSFPYFRFDELEEYKKAVEAIDKYAEAINNRLKKEEK